MIRLNTASLRLPAIAAAALLLSSATLPAQHLRVVAMDYAFRVPQHARPGVNQFTFVNQGKELHHMLVLRLPDSLDAAGAFRRISARQPIPGSRLVGGPGAVSPGDSTIAWATLEAGRYLVVCFIPAPDGMPHIMKGMFGQIEVAGARLATAAPQSRLTIIAKEYDFVLSRPLRAGTTTFEFRNEGAHDHDLQFLQLNDSGTAVTIARAVGRGGTMPDGIRATGGVSSVAPKGRAWGRVTLRPGRYAIACYESDSTRRGSHYLHGMVKEFVVR